MTLNDLLTLCRCPLCQSELSLSNDISMIHCPQGHRYPVIDKRIPIFLTEDVPTGKSFSHQWQMYQDGDHIWGWDRAKMRDLFLKNTGLKPEDVHHKTILDLGCGHGVLSVIMAEMGARVIGFDISNGFLKMDSTLKSELKARINYIQGDVFHFPLKDEIVDLVWCSGVLHHTPDTKTAFDKVYGVVKKGGRFYTWLYKNVFYTKPLVRIRKVTTKLPENILVPLCYFMAPAFAITKSFINLTGRGYRKFEKRSLRENALSLHDTLAPPYRWHHKKEEAIQWFEHAGFTNITISEDAALGFGIYGDRG